MRLWKTAKILDESHITTVLILPAGSKNDTFPHAHHLLEHLILEMEMPNGITLREYLDIKGIESRAATSRDLITFAFISPATKQHACFIEEVFSNIRSSQWDKKTESSVVSTLENEMFAIPSNMIKAARISAEFSYWGEVANLNPSYVHTTMNKVSKQLPSYLMTLIDKSLILIDDPTNLLYESMLDKITTVEDSSHKSESCEAPFQNQNTAFQVPARPTNLTSIVFGLRRKLSTLEQLSMLAVSYSLSRGMRNGILWHDIQAKQLALYHLLAWFQATSSDAILTVDWISLPDKELLVKHAVLNILNQLTKNPNLLKKELPFAIKDIRAQGQTVKEMPVVERLKAMAPEILDGNDNPSYEGLFSQVDKITVNTCLNLLTEFMESPLLFINQKGRAQFQKNIEGHKYEFNN